MKVRKEDRKKEEEVKPSKEMKTLEQTLQTEAARTQISSEHPRVYVLPVIATVTDTLH